MFLFRLKSLLFRIKLINYHIFILYFCSQMKEYLKKIFRRTIAWLLILSMGMLLANKAVFFHVHKLENGNFISHAHPFNKSADTAPFKKHHHSESELFFFSNVDQLVLALLMVFALILLRRNRNLILSSPGKYLALISLHKKGRAPPVR